MLGRISLSNPQDFDFSDSTNELSPQSASYNRAFRPQKYTSDDADVYVTGTLVGLKTELGLKEPGLEDLLKLYFKRGERALTECLEGLYFIYIIDKKSCRHILLNNNYQLTKLYYYLEGDEFFFSSRLSELAKIKKTVSPCFGTISNFLCNGFNCSDQTQIEGIKKLLPSFWIVIDQQGFGIDNNWDRQIEFNRQPFPDLQSQLDTYEQLYRGGIQNYLQQRRPDELATLLSGGHDTSFVMIQASQVFEKPIHAFTTTFPSWAFDESSYAENICRKFGGKFHAIEFGADDLDHIIDLIYSCEEPVLGSSLPLHVLATEAGQWTDTILGGDGGDTLWGEYYPVGEYHRWVKNMPLALRALIYKTATVLRKTTDWERFWELEHVSSLFAKQNFYQDFMFNLCTYRHFSPNDIDALFEPGVVSEKHHKSLLEIPFDRENFNDALIEGKLFNAFYTYQSFQQTRSMNSKGMEFYLPTINSDVINFISRLPEKWLNGGTTFHRLTNSKSINRRFHKHALSRYLKKEEIYNRSFDIPWYHILSPRPQLLALLQTRLKKRGWYNNQVIDQLFKEFLAYEPKSHELLELKSHGYRVMALMSLEIWAMQFLDGQAFNSKMLSHSLEEFFAG